MRAVWIALCSLLVIHVIAGIAFMGWLRASGRLNRDRVHRVVEIFRPTIAQERADRKLAEKVEAEAKEQAAALARLEEVADGPTTVADRLATDQQARELSLRKIERLQREIRDLTRNMEFARQQIGAQKADIDRERAAFEAYRQREIALKADDEFQRAVQTYEGLKPKQAKVMFQELIGRGEKDKVVDYLAAMQLRKSAAVLGEFKADDEVAQAAELVERLRGRGIEPAAAVPAATQTRSGGVEGRT